jgi:hypothetical protein
MAGYSKYNVKDIDGRWWSFDQQQKDYSCGPTSVKNAKQLYHNRLIAEESMRGLVGMQHLNSANSGMSLAQAAANTAGRWDGSGTMEDKVLPAVKSAPLSIPGAHFVHGISQLRLASRNRPAILGFNWTGGGGHFVVCVGPTKTDPSLFVILDPESGLEYLSADDAVGTSIVYKPSYGAEGRIDPVGFIATT